jgi:hypothetical protein
MKAFQDAKNIELTVHYVGDSSCISPEKVGKLISDELHFSAILRATRSPVETEPLTYSQNGVYYVENDKAIQNNIGFYQKLGVIPLGEKAFEDAFNNYFGQGHLSVKDRRVVCGMRSASNPGLSA